MAQGRRPGGEEGRRDRLRGLSVRPALCGLGCKWPPWPLRLSGVKGSPWLPAHSRAGSCQGSRRFLEPHLEQRPRCHQGRQADSTSGLVSLGLGLPDSGVSLLAAPPWAGPWSQAWASPRCWRASLERLSSPCRVLNTLYSLPPECAFTRVPLLDPQSSHSGGLSTLTPRGCPLSPPGAVRSPVTLPFMAEETTFTREKASFPPARWRGVSCWTQSAPEGSALFQRV